MMMKIVEMVGEWGRRLRLLFSSRAQFDREMEEEMRLHRDLRAREFHEMGTAGDEADYAAQRKFGNTLRLREESREAWGWAWADHLFMDIRYGLRRLRKSPGFTAVGVLTLALGIGANTAIFSVLSGVLLRPLPYKDAASLIVLNESTPRVGILSPSYPDFVDWRDRNGSFSEMAVLTGVRRSLSGINQPEKVNGIAVSTNFLSMLGMHTFLGRDFNASEEKPGAAPVILLSYPFWRSHFGGDPNVIGRTVALDKHSFSIIGVLPPAFRWTVKVDLLEPIGDWLTNNPSGNDRGDRGDMDVLARLRPGTSLPQARAEMEGIAASLARTYPETNDQFGVALEPLRDQFVGAIRPAVIVLFVAVTFVLLIACANVANLFLMRSAGRAQEIALRVALGANRGRIVMQMLAESLILTSLGGIAGLALAVGVIRGLLGLIPESMLAGASVNVNAQVILFTAGVVLLSTSFFGLLSAKDSTKTDVQSELKGGSRTAGSASQTRWRGILACLEISLALVLLVGTGLMMSSLFRLLSVNLGIQTEHVLTMRIDLNASQYAKDPQILSFWEQLLNRVREVPGVQAAAVGTGVPLTHNHPRVDITLEGMALPEPGSFPHPDVHVVSPGYDRVLGIQLIRGRTFTDMDNEKGERVALISSLLAQQFFRGRDPIGSRFFVGHPSPNEAPQWFTVVGVVSNTKLYGLANPARLEAYLPFRQAASSSMTLLVNSAVDPAALIPEIRRAVVSIDKDQAVYAISTMKEYVHDSESTRIITFVLLGCFSGVALLLAGIGVYGVISYSVAQRNQEIGIRMALGAQPGDVLAMVLMQTGKIAVAGVLTGLVASLCLTRLMSKLLFSVSPFDPVTFATVAGVIVATALIASYIPAHRALRVDPARTLRCEW